MSREEWTSASTKAICLSSATRCAAIVNMLKKPGASKTFQEYSETVVLPYVINQLRNVERVDVVWDRCLPGSLKDSARSEREKGIRRRVRPDTRIPGDWKALLRLGLTKTKRNFSFIPGRAAYHNWN